LVYLQPIRRNSVLKCALHPKIAKNSLKTSFEKIQGHSRSSMLIILKSLSPVLVMISSMSVPICNRFHIIRSNNGKMTYFRRVPLFDALVRGDPLHPVARNFVTINLRPWGSHSEDFVILVCTLLIQITSVADGQADAQTMAKTSEAFCFRA